MSRTSDEVLTMLENLEIDAGITYLDHDRLRAAMTMGTEIPKLCAGDNLASFGSCRMCLVEIEGRNGAPAASWRRAPAWPTGR